MAGLSIVSRGCFATTSASATSEALTASSLSSASPSLTSSSCKGSSGWSCCGCCWACSTAAATAIDDEESTGVPLLRELGGLALCRRALLSSSSESSEPSSSSASTSMGAALADPPATFSAGLNMSSSETDAIFSAGLSCGSGDLTWGEGIDTREPRCASADCWSCSAEPVTVMCVSRASAISARPFFVAAG